MTNSISTTPATRVGSAGPAQPAGANHSRPLLKRRTKDILFQATILALIVGFLAYLVRNVVVNIRALKIETGFGFLEKPAGFAISQSIIDYNRASTYLDAFLVAFLNTVLLTVVCIIISTLLGLLVALARVSANPVVSRVAMLFTEVIRNIPLLLQLLIWYFVVVRSLPSPRDSYSAFSLLFVNNRGFFFPVPMITLQSAALLAVIVAGLVLLTNLFFSSGGRAPVFAFRWGVSLLFIALPIALLSFGPIAPNWDVPAMTGFNFTGGAKVVPEFVAMMLGISIYGAAFIAEVFRGGLNAVPSGLREAGLALGLKSWFVNLKIVVPLALRASLPPLGGQYVIMLKNTSLAAAIAYPDLMQVMAGTALNQTGQPLEVMMMTLGAYVVLGLAISFVINCWNTRIMLVSR